MKITSKFKNALLAAKQDGIKTVIITKGSSYGNVAIKTIPIDDLINTPNGSDFDTGRRGYFPTKNSPRPDRSTSMQYMNLYNKYKDAKVIASESVKQLIRPIITEILKELKNKQ